MFEKYNFAGVFIQIQAVLTLYAQGTIIHLVKSLIYEFLGINHVFGYCEKDHYESRYCNFCRVNTYFCYKNGFN